MSATPMIYSNVMIDLETMGNGPAAAIAAIGAVAFDLTAGELGPTYYNRISLESAVACGGIMDASTVTWWLQQEQEARLEIARAGGLHIAEALHSFSAWMEQHTHGPEVWGNGASFDNVILRGAYHRNGITPPWSWWNDRCYRTIKAQHRDVLMERLGTHHNALDDAISQADHLIKMMRGADLNSASEWRRGVEDVARMLGKKADDFAAEYGHDDMGGLSFGSGQHAELKQDYHTNLLELADEVRAMVATAPEPIAVINQEMTTEAPAVTYVFTTGAVDAIKSDDNRHFWPVKLSADEGGKA